jgi:two-component system NarL family sensor kinase
MSEYTSSVLGHPANLAVALGTAAEAGTGFSFWRVLPLPDGILMGGQPEIPDPPASCEKTDLGPLRDHFLLHYFRLERAERRLAKRRKSNGAARFLNQMEEERKRLGSELHTGVAQLLTAIRLQVDEIERQFPNSGEAVRAAIARVRELSAEALGIVRGVSHRLHPPDWQMQPLADALEHLWELSGVPQAFLAEFHADPLPAEPGLHVKTVLYRAAQEGLSNISRHAKPEQVRMSLSYEEPDAVLRVSNDGGSVENGAKKTWGIGLHSLRDQAQTLGGRLQLQRSADGATLEVRIPLTGDNTGQEGGTNL